MVWHCGLTVSGVISRRTESLITAEDHVSILVDFKFFRVYEWEGFKVLHHRLMKSNPIQLHITTFRALISFLSNLIVPRSIHIILCLITVWHAFPWKTLFYNFLHLSFMFHISILIKIETPLLPQEFEAELFVFLSSSYMLGKSKGNLLFSENSFGKWFPKSRLVQCSVKKFHHLQWPFQ